MKLIWARGATDQLADAHEYIARDSRDAADRTIVAIREAVRVLSIHPFAGRAGRVENTRELVITGTPYIVAYQFREPETVYIIAVIHGKRRWPGEF